MQKTDPILSRKVSVLQHSGFQLIVIFTVIFWVSCHDNAGNAGFIVRQEVR